MFKKLLLLILFSFSANAFTIPENLTQGMLVYGTAEKDEEIYYEDLPVPVYNGKYVFALGRNAREEIQITSSAVGLIRKSYILRLLRANGKKTSLTAFRKIG